MRGEGGGERGGAAGEHKLRVQQRVGGLPADSGGRGVLPPKHIAGARLLRHERLLPGQRPPPFSLRLCRDRPHHRRQPQYVASKVSPN